MTRQCPQCKEPFKVRGNYQKQIFCSRECKSENVREINRNRDRQIVIEALDPYQVLETVGKKYGLSRERVRQIVCKQIKVDFGTSPGYGAVKRALIKQSSKFRCVMCGGIKKYEKRKARTKFCSYRCHQLYYRFDFESPRTCLVCKHQFFPHRNWNYPSQRGKANYCSSVCYFKSVVFKANMGRPPIISLNFAKKLIKIYETSRVREFDPRGGKYGKEVKKSMSRKMSELTAEEGQDLYRYIVENWDKASGAAMARSLKVRNSIIYVAANRLRKAGVPLPRKGHATPLSPEFIEELKGLRK